ncbi:MAG: hypothetical protein D5R96_02920 [Methanocalculus sp. MSAO_Arc2]|uniref:hypothetical protein n=1 Tax=Methanocalculus sp. MSAO_Arc2 TaxID=2293855 RepID=UPI000FF08E1D|nr:MAG: hypothetical protein D5R96_02920 [Methanocalculus sp. MSAO_Arc2]
MGYRTHARHTTCPGCREEIYIEELVGGNCPLCGSAIDEADASEETIEFEEIFERSELSWLVLQYFLFKRFQELGANPLQVFRLLSSIEENGDMISSGQEKEHYAYDLDADMSRVERLLPKRCSSCGKLFVRGAKKKISGNLLISGMTISYRCNTCTVGKGE